MYWVGLKYVLQTLDAIRYLCQQLQDILEDMEGYWKLIMVFLWQVDLVFPYPTQHFRHLNSIMYSLCVIQDFYLIAWDQTAPCHSDIIDTDNNYKNEFKNVFLKCTCVHNCAAVFTFSQSEVVGAVCLLPPLLSKKKKTSNRKWKLQTEATNLKPAQSTTKCMWQWTQHDEGEHDSGNWRLITTSG